MTNRDDETGWTSRELGALAATTAAVTLAIGVTLAALGGRLVPPERDAPPDEGRGANASAEEAQVGSRVVLVPVERAPVPSEAAGLVEPARSEVEPRSDEVEGEQRERHGRHEREEHGEHRRRREHREHRDEPFWGDDDEEGFDG